MNAVQEREIEKALNRRKLEFFQPYPKQLEFFNATGRPGMREIGFIAGSQCGKTISAAAMVAILMTGKYPEWYHGRKFTTPVTGWIGSTSGQATRDGMQRLLLGPGPSEWGTGLIPGRSIIEVKKSLHGVPDAAEIVLVRHEDTGKTSRIVFKSYDQGRLRWQNETLNFVGFDEEPPADIYSEGKTRTQVGSGFVFLTFTPLLGMSEVVTRLLRERPENTCVVNMGIKDALHYSEEERKIIIAGYPEHEREARANGLPVQGSGAVFSIPAAWITEVPIEIPDFWPRVCGLDIGWTHATAAVWVAHDRDADVMHIYDCYKMKEQTPVVHAAAIKSRGAWIPVAWPPDSLRHDPGSGKIIADQYRSQGVNMLPVHATHPPLPGKKEHTGGFGTEAGIMEMLTRMQTGRLKVASHLSEFFDEYQNYYRDINGLLVKKNDDIMSAARMATMSLRFARNRVVRDTMPVLPVYYPRDPGMGSMG